MSFSEREPRKAVELEVELKDFTFAEINADGSTNLSAGGAFIKMNSPHRPGTLIKFVLKVSADKEINGVARVVWKRDDALGENAPAGVGIKFVKLSQESRELLNEVLEGAEEAPSAAPPSIAPSEVTESKSIPPQKIASLAPRSLSKPPKTPMSTPPKSVSRAPRVSSAPVKTISDPPKALSKPPKAPSEPPEEVEEPPKAPVADGDTAESPVGGAERPSDAPKKVGREETASWPPESRSFKEMRESKPPIPSTPPTAAAAPPPDDDVDNAEEWPAATQSTPPSSPSTPPEKTAKSGSGILFVILALALIGGVAFYVLKGKETAPMTEETAAGDIDQPAAPQEPAPPPTQESPETKAPEPEKPAVVADAGTASAAVEAQDTATSPETAAKETVSDTDTTPPAAEAEQAPAGESAVLTINTNPEGASVFIDGVAVAGSTPLSINTLVMNKPVEVKVQMIGFAEVKQQFSPEQKETTWDLKLDVARVRFKMSSTPPGARILIDGKYNGKTPFTFMRARYKPEFKYRIEKRRYEPVEGIITPKDWEIEGRFHVFTLDVTLEPK